MEIRKTYYDKARTKIKIILYTKKGTCIWHREDGPARQVFYESGELQIEAYWINDKLHREDGPARIWYNEDGSIDHQQFWLNDSQLSEKEFKMKQRLKGTLLEGKY